jgi:hypothetical protein
MPENHIYNYSFSQQVTNSTTSDLYFSSYNSYYVNYTTNFTYSTATNYLPYGNNFADLTHSILVDEDKWVNVPYQAMTSDEAWVAWVNADLEQADKRQRAREIYNQQQQERERKRALEQAEEIAAKAKARALLFDFLDDAQRKSWIDHSLFYKEINGKNYKFTVGTHGNVYLMDGETPVERFCIAPRAPHNGGYCPIDDVVLAQMLLLSADEAEFRRIANITPLVPRNLARAA